MVRRSPAIVINDEALDTQSQSLVKMAMTKPLKKLQSAKTKMRQGFANTFRKGSNQCLSISEISVMGLPSLKQVISLLLFYFIYPLYHPTNLSIPSSILVVGV